MNLHFGKNNLNLGYSPGQIFKNIKGLLFKIKEIYSKVLIFNISIKPSVDRIDKLIKIKKINHLLKIKLMKSRVLIKLMFMTLS